MAKKLGKVCNYFGGKIVGIFSEMNYEKPSLLKESCQCGCINGTKFSNIGLNWTEGKAVATFQGQDGQTHEMPCSSYEAHLCFINNAGDKIPAEEVIGTSVKAWNALWNTMKSLWFEGPSDISVLYKYHLKKLSK